MTWWNSSADLILVLGASGGCCVSIIYAVCVNMRMSRCKTIRACGCICDRDVETAEEMKMELEHDNHGQQNRNNPAGNPRADI